ncbi:hypothetical protein C8R46DRAFT_1115585 [Mycena filopes]|nr:hypothetical protein C8R46DRAFT_1115585 [Mycena filopes]
MRLISAMHVSLALIWTVYAIPVPPTSVQEISNPPIVPEAGDRFTTSILDLSPALLSDHQRRVQNVRPTANILPPGVLRPR